MKSNYYVEVGEALPYIKAYGRCAITGQPFNDAATICAVLLPGSAEWPLPVWDDYPMGSNAKAVAFILPPPAERLIPHCIIAEATQCDGRTITFHPVTFKTEEANETATVQEV